MRVLRYSVLLLLLLMLGACATTPRTLRSTAFANSAEDFWVLVGSESGLPRTSEAKEELMAAWFAAASATCGGSFVGEPSLQVTSFARAGQPFADPFAPATDTRFTAALGSAHCTSLFASAAER